MLTNLTLLFDRSLYWILIASFILLKKSKIPFLSELYLDTVTHYWKINTWKFPGGQKVKNNYSNMRVGTIDCSFYIMLSAYSLQVEQLFSEPMCIWTFFQLFIHLFITFFCCCVFLVNTLLGMNALYQPTQICIFFQKSELFYQGAQQGFWSCSWPFDLYSCSRFSVQYFDSLKSDSANFDNFNFILKDSPASAASSG